MKARKKPVVIECVQLEWNTWNEMCDFVTVEGFRGVYLNNDGTINTQTGSGKMGAVIPTLEGDMVASEHDYIIKGVNGEFYPCKPDIFLKTYDILEGED